MSIQYNYYSSDPLADLAQLSQLVTELDPDTDHAFSCLCSCSDPTIIGTWCAPTYHPFENLSKYEKMMVLFKRIAIPTYTRKNENWGPDNLEEYFDQDREDEDFQHDLDMVNEIAFDLDQDMKEARFLVLDMVKKHGRSHAKTLDAWHTVQELKTQKARLNNASCFPIDEWSESFRAEFSPVLGERLPDELRNKAYSIFGNMGDRHPERRETLIC